MLEYFILLLLAALTIVFVSIILWTPTVTRSTDKATQTDNTIQIEDINKVLKCISDNINKLHQECLQFSMKQGMTYSLTDTLTTSVSSSFKNID